MTGTEVGRDALPNILLVDDDEILRERLAQAIRARGYEVKTAGSAEEALREVAKDSPEMAVLDLKMPGMSGLDLLRELSRKQLVAKLGFRPGSTYLETCDSWLAEAGARGTRRTSRGASSKGTRAGASRSSSPPAFDPTQTAWPTLESQEGEP